MSLGFGDGNERLRIRHRLWERVVSLEREERLEMIPEFGAGIIDWGIPPSGLGVGV